MKKNFLTTKQMALIGVMTAVTCILGPLSIPLPFSPVPISFTVLAVYLSAYVLGPKLGTISFLVYLLIGIIGLPVFSGFTGGIGKLAGPTGGYLAGFILMAPIAGWAIWHFKAQTIPSFLGMILGTVVCYLFGTIWLARQNSLSFMEALAVGVLPYLIGDAAKMVVAWIIGTRLYHAANRFAHHATE